MPTSETPLILIPAAGFGVRVGRPPAKELLKGSSGQPMILNPLQMAHERHWYSLVITRAEKSELLQFLAELNFKNMSVLTIPTTVDWPDTLLKSEMHWHTRNLVLLPDTEWQPLSVLDEMSAALHHKDVVFASHDVESVSTWGCMIASSDKLRLCEKPQESRRGRAWGVFGFKNSVGAEILKAQSRSTASHQWETLNLKSAEFNLHRFCDLTRVRI